MASKERVEFVNTTETTIIWVEHGATESKEGRSRAVKPGESIFFTEEDIRIQEKEDKNAFILDGRLRRVGKNRELIPSQIKIRDDMSALEIELFVKNTADAKALGTKMRYLTSMGTANAIMAECEKQDKPVSFIRSCLKKVNSLAENKRVDLKNRDKDEKKLAKENKDD